MCVCVCNRCVCNLCVGNLCVYGRISTKDVDRYEKIPKRAPHMGVGRIFSRGVYSGFFQMVTKIFFQGWPTVMKFHFTNSKLREELLSTKTLKGKYQISKSREDWPPCHPLPTPMAPTSVSVIELLSHQWTFFASPKESQGKELPTREVQIQLQGLPKWRRIPQFPTSSVYLE